jgi:hypothetical protein
MPNLEIAENMGLPKQVNDLQGNGASVLLKVGL